MTVETQATARPRLGLMLLISLSQGFVLLLLWRAATNEVWPSQTPVLNFPFWTVAVALPLLLLLGLEDMGSRKTAVIVTLFCAVLALLAAYTGWQATPYDAFPIDSIAATFILPTILACFLALLHLRPLVTGTTPDYAETFAASWRNALVAALAWALALGVTGVLMLWGELFRAIGIDFFIDLFTEDWFLFPVLSVAVGLGIFIFRGLANVIGGITSLLQGLMWLLLPLVLLVTVLFLGALPFTGLEPLWDTGSGTALLMALNLFALFALNAVYQRGDQESYPSHMHHVLSVGVALLPVISLLALYGLYLRVDQYGWTVARCWALLISLLITLYSLGYAGSVLRFRQDWTGKLAGVNLPMSMVLLGVLLLVNSPLIDFRKLSLASQQARVERGEIALADFDFHHAREFMGRPAWLWMQEVIEENRESDPELAALVREPVRLDASPFEAPEASVDFRARVAYRPEPFEIPESMLEEMQFSAVAARARLDSELELVLVRADLDLDGMPEYVLIGERDDVLVATGFQLQQEGGWRRFQLVSRGAPEDPEQDLASGAIEAIAPEFSDLRIGNITLRAL